MERWIDFSTQPHTRLLTSGRICYIGRRYSKFKTEIVSSIAIFSCGPCWRSERGIFYFWYCSKYVGDNYHQRKNRKKQSSDCWVFLAPRSKNGCWGGGNLNSIWRSYCQGLRSLLFNFFSLGIGNIFSTIEIILSVSHYWGCMQFWWNNLATICLANRGFAYI